jgi:GntR family transcriptional regulator, transcriptional repressor for pyruvate dehydrogenase complex
MLGRGVTIEPGAGQGGTERGSEVSRVLDQVLDEAAPAPVLRPVRLATKAEEVADRLITAVAVGEFLPGDRLPVERELARMLGVSRPSVREAISRLQAAGIVRIRRGRLGGAYVCESWTSASAAAVRRTLLPRWDELEQLFDVRGLVEEMVARTAAQRRTDEDIKRIRHALEMYASARTVREEHTADTAFHQAVSDATGNPQIVALSREMLTRVTLGLAIEPCDDDPRVYERAMREHTAMGEAIIAGEAERAGEIAREHFTITARTLREALSRGMESAEAGQ